MPCWGFALQSVRFFCNGLCQLFNLQAVFGCHFYSCMDELVVWYSRVGQLRTLTRIIQGCFWVIWFTRRATPERENRSPVPTAIILSNCLPLSIEVDFKPAAAPGHEDVKDFNWWWW